MTRNALPDDERAASIAITHALTLAITAILITSLLVTAGNYLTEQRNSVAQSQLRDVGGDVASLIDRADRLNETGSSVNATFDANYPDRIAGEPYTVALVPDSGDSTNATLYLNASELGQSVAIQVQTETPMTDSRTSGENPTVKLCTDTSGAHTIALGRCS
jgi:hypothetical protein